MQDRLANPLVVAKGALIEASNHILGIRKEAVVSISFGGRSRSRRERLRGARWSQDNAWTTRAREFILCLHRMNNESRAGLCERRLGSQVACCWWPRPRKLREVEKALAETEHEGENEREHRYQDEALIA
jgi:hypothetical protein